MGDGFRILDYTADVGIAAEGKDLSEAFANAARGMFSIITELDTIRESTRREIVVSAPDRESLLVAWLNELIYLFDVENLVFASFDIRELTGTGLRATAFGEPVDPSRHKIKIGVKAATYHRLEIRENDRAEVKVVLDIQEGAMVKGVQPAPWTGVLDQIDDYRWEIPISYMNGMRVPGLIYASREMIARIWEDRAFEQVANVATLPGIVDHALAMPDIHYGYGFPIGGVAAMRVDDGVVSPGGVGFDINCGVRLLRTNLTEADVRPVIEKLVESIYRNVPSGVGSSGRLKVNARELDEVMVRGAAWAVEKGFGDPSDLVLTEESGAIRGADPDKVSKRARERGTPQLGTLGSGNHFLEVAYVAEIYESAAAKTMGIGDIGQVVVWIHTGSRGFGHQVCTDYLASLGPMVKKLGIDLPDRQLACAPVQSPEGRDYLGAMAAAANYAWTNRQCIAHWTRESFLSVFGKTRRDLGLQQVYDVAHNIAKIEKHRVLGKEMTLCVHRKGATRAFGPGRPEVPDAYRKIGQPVLIPGDMGRYSYIAVGTETAMEETFGSTCHGAGRLQSRHAAKKNVRGADVIRELATRGITVRAATMSDVAEEASPAYKDVADVVNVTDSAGISRKVARTVPMGVVKG